VLDQALDTETKEMELTGRKDSLLTQMNPVLQIHDPARTVSSLTSLDGLILQPCLDLITRWRDTGAQHW